jgi:hypothetical protein
MNYKKILNNSIEKNPLGFLYQTDTLTLSAMYAECGEFGGHKEVMKIYRNYKREYFLHFIQDSIDLDCPNDFEEKAVIIKDTTIKINLKHEKLIVKYLDKLYKRAIEPKFISHSNEYFRATTNYSAFSLSTAEPKKDWHEFRKLKQALIK